MSLIQLDYTHCLSDVLGDGRGLTNESVSILQDRVNDALDLVQELGALEEPTFLTLPEQDTSAIQALADEIGERFDDLVVIGIGGSSLGARAVDAALRLPFTDRLRSGAAARCRVHFVENVDPDWMVDLLASLDLETTCFNVVTKSGGTIETMSNFFIVRDALQRHFGEDGWRERIIATTDPENGTLRQLAIDDRLRSLPVPPRVGGRFSVLTAVGLFPLAAAGVDIKALLAGAARARDNAYRADVGSNVAGTFAATQVGLYEAGITDVVLMPYSNALQASAAGFVQLWAESLGKMRTINGERGHVGPTPIPAVGATDQHSQLQLFMEGPATKNVVFIDVGRGAELVVPPAPSACSNLSHLSGKTITQIRDAELRGVRAGLAEAGRPSMTLRMDGIREETVGALLMVFEAATAIAGPMLGIDPFNQPGVELAKRYAHGILGRAKERHYAERLEQADAASRRIAEL